jgi:stage III sporulation protein AE
MIPVVGSSISDAYSSLIGSINLIKGSVAFVGIIVIVIINLPIVLENLICYISFSMLSYMAESFITSRTADILRLFAGGIRILLLLCLFEMFVIIITVGVMLSVRGGT